MVSVFPLKVHKVSLRVLRGQAQGIYDPHTIEAHAWTQGLGPENWHCDVCSS